MTYSPQLDSGELLPLMETHYPTVVEAMSRAIDSATNMEVNDRGRTGSRLDGYAEHVTVNANGIVESVATKNRAPQASSLPGLQQV